MSGTYEVQAALITQLTAASPGAAVSAASVQWENRPFTPTIGTRWYRATFMPAEPSAAAVSASGANRHRGVFQVDVFDPPDLGHNAGVVEAERIVACFKRGTSLTYSGVTVVVDKAYRLPAVQEPEWYHVPVRVFFRADVTN